MRKLRAILLIIVLFFALCFIKDKSANICQLPSVEQALINEAEKGVGEKIVYDVKLGSLNLGRSTFTQIPSIELNGRLLNVMIFETDLARFKDVETIYTDPATLLPIKIQRDVTNWFSREIITEEYNQEDFSVTINKKKGSKNETFTIKKDAAIHNAILLPQHIRRTAKLDNNEVIIANLPNRKYEMKMISIDEVKVPAGTFKAYHYKSSPAQIDIWISTDERKIPIKIQSNSIGFGYIMVLREYKLDPPKE